jgi:hypothetical protein
MNLARNSRQLMLVHGLVLSHGLWAEAGLPGQPGQALLSFRCCMLAVRKSTLAR